MTPNIAEDFYRILVYDAPEPVMLLDAETGVFVDSNVQALELFGYTKEELLKLGPWDISPETISDQPSKSRAFHHIEKALAGMVESFEWLHLDSSGKAFPCEIRLVRFPPFDKKLLRASVTDLSEQTETKQALIESEKKFKAAFNQQFQFMAILSPKGEILEINDLAVSTSKASPQELKGTKLWELPAWKDMDDWHKVIQQRIEQVAQGNGPIISHASPFNRDGQIGYTDASYSSIKNADGQVEFVLVQASDITERKLVEDALKESEERFRSIVQDQTEMIVKWLPGGVRTFVSDSYCDMFELNREEVLGTSFFDAIKTDDFELVMARIEAITPSNPISSGIHKVNLPDGKVGWQEWADRGFFDENGKVTSYQSVGRDVTERRMNLLEIQDQKKRLDTIFENTKDIMALYRCVNDQFIFESVNTALIKATQSLGIQIEEADFKDLNVAFFHNQYFKMSQEESDKRTDLLRTVVASKSPFEFVEHRQYKGQDAHAEARLTPIINNGEVTHILAVYHDVTEARKNASSLQIALEELGKLKSQIERENIYLRQERDLRHNFQDMVFSSDAFKRVLKEVEQVAPLNATVLITGETGTGKELIAHAIHALSPRVNGPMIKVNCAALPADLIESELFGHEKGAFTGAIAAKAGRFELAHNGTIFLDEIGEMSLDVQAKVLRVIQDSKFERVGGTKTLSSDVRIIAATNRDLETSVRDGHFREDLFFRLNVFPIKILPLRDRPEDVPILTEHFVDKYNKRHGKTAEFISDQAMTYLNNYSWPGNIRELENVIERAVILSEGEVLNLHYDNPEETTRSIQHKPESLADAQRSHILKVLRSCNWQIEGENGSAAILDIKPSTLRDRMKKLGISRNS